MRLDDESAEKLVVVTMRGLFEPTTLPYGPKTGPPVFQQRMTEEVLPGLDGKECEAFMDDVGVGADDFPDLLRRLRLVFERAREFNLRFNGRKCMIGDVEMEYVGYLINGAGRSPTQHCAQGVADMQPPRDKTQLHAFLGVGNVFRPHIAGYATLTKPLTRLTSKNVE